MFNFLNFFSKFLPLKIEFVSWNEDNLTISGNDWSFTTNSAWRVSKDNKLLFACWDENVINSVKELMDISIINMSWIDDAQAIDPLFSLSDGSRLEIFCTSSLEPWVLRCPDSNIYIGNS